MRTPLGTLIVVLIMIAIDLYVYFAIRSLTVGSSQRLRNIVFAAYWAFSILSIAGLVIFFSTGHDFMPKKIRTYLFAIVIGLFLSKIIASVFFIIDDLRRVIQWIAAKLFFNNTEGAQMNEAHISRSAFLTWLGLAAGGTLFSSLVYGFSNKYNYQVKKVKLSFDNLPPAFRGLKILQFSDVHSGSFTNKEAVMRGVDMIMKQQADIIIFSGDLVNDMATEMEDYMDVFNKVKAPMGVYSVFGNHDYGDYVTWPRNGVTKAQNLENLAGVHQQLGWELLRNRHVIIEKDGDSFPLIGVENWSNVGRFPKYGDLPKAHSGAEGYPFKILISHDPSHWDAQVRPQFPDIDLTLSGHTHGMQFGVEIPGFKWSPVQYVYKEWDGLYTEGKQKLYVNPGYGFIGYPGRVGILPEITVFELV